MRGLRLLCIGSLLIINATAFAQPGAAGQPPPGPSFTPPDAGREAPSSPPLAALSNLPSIDVGALIERLADEMDKEFVLDPRMAGVFGGTTAAEDADYETLLAILRQSGFATVETANQILIVPDATIRTQPSRLVQADDRRISDHEIVTRVIDVPGSARTNDGTEISMAAQLVPLLRPMMGQSAQLGTVAGSGKLIIVDRYDNVRRITAVVEALLDQAR